MFDIALEEVPLVVSSEGGHLSVRCECAVSKTLCAALNVLLRTPLDGAPVVTRYRAPDGKSWDRDTRDEFRRLMDRAVVRLDPPVDTRCVAHPQWLTFHTDTNIAELTLAPGVCGIHLPASCRSFSLEGIAYYFDESTATTPFKPRGEDKERKRLAWVVGQHICCEWLLPQVVDPEESRPNVSSSKGFRAEQSLVQSPDAFAFAMASLQRGETARRVVHVEPRGLSLQAAVIAVTDTKAVLAVRSSFTTSGLEVIGQIPVPIGLRKYAEAAILAGTAAHSRRKRDRDETIADGITETTHGSLAKVLLGTERTHHRVVVLPCEEGHLVEVKAFRVHITMPSSATTKSQDEACLTALVELDDVISVSPCISLRKQPDGGVAAHKSDVVALIRSSCKEALRTSELLKTDLLLKGSAAHRLRKSMMDTTTSAFTKDKKNAKSALKGLESEYPLKPYAPKAAVPEDFSLHGDETALVEFKAKAGEWIQEPDAVTGSGNRERLRHALTAFANTFGGYLVIGVRDDGRVLGVGDEEAQVRTSGFCPTLFSGAIENILHKVKASGITSMMPADWWRLPSGAPHSQAPAVRTAVSAPSKVISVYRVQPGSAPFYEPSKYTIPSVRGFCSTLRMPFRVCCSRIERMLPASSEKVTGLPGSLSAAALASVGLRLEDAQVVADEVKSDVGSAQAVSGEL